ncbi:hypothetical protein UVI_02043840 [Ustilaginoidea virens]|uniref:Uncharacterized protein n=1 Tax=Ustilaginoidea virens TaxID=1159556 RepID=A0A1B5L4C6_USTVR|nr:hypothetical protein UVI_02043840 [Ustilaginoidea virens]
MYVFACLPPHETDHEQRSAESRDLIGECKSDRRDRQGWKDRISGIQCDGNMSSCPSAVVQAEQVFGRIDILLCCSLEGIPRGSGAPYQFLFSQGNFIKATFPVPRKQHTGHLIALTSTCGHLGTPGLAILSAVTGDLEDYCDSLVYEVSVQSADSVSLTSRLTFAPQTAAYVDAYPSAPNVRDILINVLDSDPETAVPEKSYGNKSAMLKRKFTVYTV